MTRALLWKEFREQRRLVLAAWLIVLVLPLFLVAGMVATTPQYEPAAVGQMLSVILAALVWPVFGAATGASTVAADRTDDSLRFLLSRPVSRSRVWVAKVVAAAAALALVIGGSVAIGVVFDYGFSGRLRPFGAVDVDGAYPFVALAVSLFVGAHYCSLFFRRPLAAALAGFVVMASMLAVVTTAWGVLARAPTRGSLVFREGAAGAGVPLALAGLLLAAWWGFTRGSLFEGNQARRMAVPLAVVTFGVALLGAVPGTWMGAREMTRISAGLPPGVALVDEAMAVVRPTPSGLSTRVAFVNARTGEHRLLGARNASAPVISADGTLIAYMRYPGALSYLTTGEAEVRVVRADGSDDRRLMSTGGLSRFNRRPLLSISPDNRHVALYSGRASVIVVAIDHENAVPRLLGVTDESGRRGSYELIGWTSGPSHELLFLDGFDRSAGRARIVALDPETEVQRTVVEIPGRPRRHLQGAGGNPTLHRAWRWFPLWVTDGSDSFGLSREQPSMTLVDTGTGGSFTLSDTACDVWGFVPDGSRLLYADCSGVRFDVRMDLRLLDLTSGREEHFAQVHQVNLLAAGRELLPSPDGERVAIYMALGHGAPGTYLIGREAAPEQAIVGADPVTGGTARAAMSPADGLEQAMAREAAQIVEVAMVGAQSGSPRVELVAQGRFPVGWLDDRHLVVVGPGVDAVETASTSSRPAGWWGPHFAIEVVDVGTRATVRVYGQ